MQMPDVPTAACRHCAIVLKAHFRPVAARKQMG